jgi:hypothetical protein
MPPMSDRGLSGKERALLEAARREAGAKRPQPAAPPARPAPARPAPAGSAGPRAPSSPLDAPTVLGWDNPAAQAAASSADEQKWARIASLMERERRDAEARRRRARRNGYAVAGALVVILAIVFARALLR